MLGFGYGKGVPPDARACWGARLIAHQNGYLDFVANRTAFGGKDGDPGDEATKDLATWINGGSFKAALDAATELLRSYEMRTGEEQEFTLYADDTGRIVGNTNASHGYLYIAAYRFADLGVTA